MGAPPGNYLNEPVERIVSDPVALFVVVDALVDAPEGRTHVLFGAGYHLVHFTMAGGKDVTWGGPVTAVTLADFAYDYLARTPPVALPDDLEYVVGERVVRVPLSTRHLPEQKRTFVRGVLARHLFVRFREVVDRLLEHAKFEGSFNPAASGHVVLRADREAFNARVVPVEWYVAGAPEELPAPGVKEVRRGSGEWLAARFPPEALEKVNAAVAEVGRALAEVVADPSDPCSLLDRLDEAWPPVEASFPPGETRPGPTAAPARSGKKPLLASASRRSEEVVAWPEDLPRPRLDSNVAEDARTTAVTPDLKRLVREFHQKVQTAEVDPSQATGAKVDAEVRESYQLRRLERPDVPAKTLPDSPRRDLEEILLYLKWVVEEDYDLPSVAAAFDMAREAIRDFNLNYVHLRELSRVHNRFRAGPAGKGLSVKEKEEVSRDVDAWLEEVREEKRREKERREREERERLERERREREEEERKRREEEERLRKEAEERARLKQQLLEKKRRERAVEAIRAAPAGVPPEEHVKALAALAARPEAEGAKGKKTERLKQLKVERKRLQKEKKARLKELKRLKKERKNRGA
ncbi:MAG: hypothetical protein Kow0069_33560 [Promethearchaeota archaeon]